MDLANIMLSEISQTVKDKYSMSSLLCRIQKIKQMNIYNKTDTDAQIIENKLVVTSREMEGGEGEDWGRGLRDINHYI